MPVVGHVTLSMIEDAAEIAACASPAGKPFLRMTLPDGAVVDISTNLAEMIGGAGAGLRKRWEDRQRGAH